MGKRPASLKMVPKAPSDSEVILDLMKQLEAGKKAREDKLTQSVAHLQSQLEMAAKKYLTVNGFMQARTTLEQVAFGQEDDGSFSEMASELADRMSVLAKGLAQTLGDISIEEVDETFIDGLLIEDFVGTDFTFQQLAEQLLIVNLLQNVGPVIDELVQFRVSVDEGIATIEAEIVKHTPCEVAVEDDLAGVSRD
jgi:hypothetical protein